MKEERVNIDEANESQSQYHYGTFQGVANFYHPSPPTIGFPQPVQPPSSSVPDPRFPVHGYQTVQGGVYPQLPPGYRIVPSYAVYDGVPMREHRLPCCGMGMGWLLFILGFFFGGFPWYIGTIIVLFVSVDHREKAGYVACVIGAALAVIAIMLGVTNGGHAW